MNFSEHDAINDEASSPASEPDADARHMTLGTGDFSEQDLALVDEKPRLKLNSGAMLIVLLAVIAAGGLFSMRTLTRASADVQAPEGVLESIEEFLDVVMKQGADARGGKEGVLEVLNESYAERQVPLEEVQRNPFIIFEDRLTAAPAPTGAPTDPLAARRRARTEEFERAANQLRIGMILMGSTPMANVNNRVVRVGDRVPVSADVEFRVARIDVDRVELVAEDEELGVTVERTLRLRRD